MTSVEEGYKPHEHFRNLKGQMYLEVKHRITWFRDEHADGYILTDLVEHDAAAGLALFKARAGWFTAEDRESFATGYGSETKADFTDYVEKAETKAVGRALACLGYGTAQAMDLDEGGSVADSPVERRPRPTQQQRAPARAPRTADPALLKLQRQLHEKSQHDQEGKIDLWKYLEDHGKERISELDAAETAEWLMIFNDRAVTPQAAQEVRA